MHLFVAATASGECHPAARCIGVLGLLTVLAAMVLCVQAAAKVSRRLGARPIPLVVCAAVVGMLCVAGFQSINFKNSDQQCAMHDRGVHTHAPLQLPPGLINYSCCDRQTNRQTDEVWRARQPAEGPLLHITLCTYR